MLRNSEFHHGVRATETKFRAVNVPTPVITWLWPVLTLKKMCVQANPQVRGSRFCVNNRPTLTWHLFGLHFALPVIRLNIWLRNLYCRIVWLQTWCHIRKLRLIRPILRFWLLRILRNFKFRERHNWRTILQILQRIELPRPTWRRWIIQGFLIIWDPFGFDYLGPSWVGWYSRDDSATFERDIFNGHPTIGWLHSRHSSRIRLIVLPESRRADAKALLVCQIDGQYFMGFLHLTR